MNCIVLNTDIGQRFVLPKSSILLIDMTPVGKEIIVRVHHAAPVYNPIIVYRGNDETEALRIITEIETALE